MIANVHEFFDKEKREEQPIMVGNVLRRTSEALKVSERSICNVLKERRVEGDVSSPAKKGRKPSCGPAQQQTDNFLEGVIRQRVHRFYTNSELPTMERPLLVLRDNVDYPYGRSSLYTTVKKMGFRYKTRNKKTALYEQHRIIAACHEYLRKILTFRSEGRPIVYLDETWLNAHHTREHCWIDYDGKGGLCVPSGKGGRLIILHAGWEQGWIADAELVFRGKTGTGDYHQEKNTKHFMEWCEKKPIPNCPSRSVIVLDSAKYHNSVVEKIPTKSSTKKAMTDYLDSHNISYDKKRLKAEIFMLIKACNPQITYLTDVVTVEKGHRVLRLPVGHCELNLTDLVWAQVKGYAAANNKDFTMAVIERFAKEGIQNVAAEKWKKCVDYVIREVKLHYRTCDGIVEQVVERLVIEVSNDDSSSSESEEIFVSDSEDVTDN